MEKTQNTLNAQDNAQDLEALSSLDNNTIYCYRFMWTEKPSDGQETSQTPDHVCFRLVTDLKEGILSFAKSLLQVPGVEKVTAEYLCEYNSAMLGYILPIDDTHEVVFKFVDFASQMELKEVL